MWAKTAAEKQAKREAIKNTLNLFNHLNNQNLSTMPRTLSTGANLFRFETPGVSYVGRYTGINKSWDSDSNEPGKEHKAGDIIGYEFEDAKGDYHLIGASWAIEDAMSKVGSGDYLRITFLGQSKSKKGNVNRFKVEVFDTDHKEDRDELTELGFELDPVASK